MRSRCRSSEPHRGQRPGVTPRCAMKLANWRSQQGQYTALPRRSAERIVPSSCGRMRAGKKARTRRRCQEGPTLRVAVVNVSERLGSYAEPTLDRPNNLRRRHDAEVRLSCRPAQALLAVTAGRTCARMMARAHGTRRLSSERAPRDLPVCVVASSALASPRSDRSCVVATRWSTGPKILRQRTPHPVVHQGGLNSFGHGPCRSHGLRRPSRLSLTPRNRATSTRSRARARTAARRPSSSMTHLRLTRGGNVRASPQSDTSP